MTIGTVHGAGASATTDTGNGTDTDADIGTAPEGAGETVAPTSGRDPIVLAAAAVVLVPTFAAMLSALRNDWVPTNDWALLELAVRGVGTADTPLLGAWSRFGWRHPGPLPFYLLAVPYRLAPSGAALLFAAAAVNLLAVAGCAALAVRHPRTRALVLLTGLAALQLGLGVDQLSDPWNPTLPILPFALYLLLCVKLATAPGRWTVPAAVGVASFVVQAHVGFIQPVLLAGVVAFALRRRLRARATPAGADTAAAGRSREEPTDPEPPRWLRMARTGAVLAIAWLPVAIDQAGRTGNAGMLVRWSLGDDVAPGMGDLTEGRLPVDSVLRSGAWLLDPVGVWLGASDPVETLGYQLLGVSAPLTLAWVPLALVAAVVLTRRTGTTDQRRAVVGAAAIAGAGALATITDLLTAEGLPVHWPFRWAAVVVMLVWVTAGWAVAAALVRRYPGLDRPIRWRAPRMAPLAGTGLGVGMVALPVTVSLVLGTLGRQPEQAESDALLRLVPAIEREARRRPVVVANSTVLINPVDLGLPVVLERAGIPWIEHDDSRARDHERLSLTPADALDGALGMAVEQGHAEVLARSGPPGPGEPLDSELLFIAFDRDSPIAQIPQAPDASEGHSAPGPDRRGAEVL